MKAKKAITFFCLLFLLIDTQTAQAQTFTEEEVTFQNGSVELSGTMIVPRETDEAPAVVFLHGSGSHQRAGFRPYAEKFAKLGIASLFFDKRGTGSSSGSWTTSSLEDLAKDALAGVEYLKNQEKIDPNRIGFWGISQAGWVAPLAASMSPDVAFMIINSGGGASPKESEYYSFEQIFEHVGLSEETKSGAFEIVDSYFQFLATGEGRSQLVARLNELEADSSDPLHRLPGIIIVPSEENQPNWSWVATYDPVPDIKKFSGPVLLLFGDTDTEQPTDLAVKKWKEGLQRADNDNVTLMVFPDAGHGIRLGAGHNRDAPFADGYMEIQLGWLWQHVVRAE